MGGRRYVLGRNLACRNYAICFEDSAEKRLAWFCHRDPCADMCRRLRVLEKWFRCDRHRSLRIPDQSLWPRRRNKSSRAEAALPRQTFRRSALACRNPSSPRTRQEVWPIGHDTPPGSAARRYRTRRPSSKGRHRLSCIPRARGSKETECSTAGCSHSFLDNRPVLRTTPLVPPTLHFDTAAVSIILKPGFFTSTSSTSVHLTRSCAHTLRTAPRAASAFRSLTIPVARFSSR